MSDRHGPSERSLANEPGPAEPGGAADDAIRVRVKALARPSRGGGMVIERAAVLASGQDATAILRWISAHAGVPEEETASPQRRGLHGARLHDDLPEQQRAPRRYLLPADALA